MEWTVEIALAAFLLIAIILRAAVSNFVITLVMFIIFGFIAGRVFHNSFIRSKVLYVLVLVVFFLVYFIGKPVSESLALFIIFLIAALVTNYIYHRLK